MAEILRSAVIVFMSLTVMAAGVFVVFYGGRAEFARGALPNGLLPLVMA